MYLFTFERFGEDFHVYDNEHVNQKRGNAYSTRNKNFTNEKLHEIFNLACGEMTQFRNKGDIGITFINEHELSNGVLCSLIGNKIYIITVIENINRATNDIFRKCSKIFLRNYIFTRPDDYEADVVLTIAKKVQPNKIKITKKQGRRVFADEVLEDDVFLKTMKNCKRI